MTVTKKLGKICLSNTFIDDEIFCTEKGSPVAILFVYISLATVTSSKANVENSAKAWYVDEIDSYCFLNFEINKSIKEFYENEDLCKTISIKYTIKRLLH